MKRRKFLEGLNIAAKALRRGYGEINISVHQKMMEISAASQNLTIWTYMEADCPDMRIRVMANEIIGTVSKIPDEEISIICSDTTCGNVLTILGENSRIVLPTTAYVEYKHITDFASKVPVKGLAKYVSQVVHALDQKGGNPLMRAVDLKVAEDGNIYLTALDGKRCSIRNTATGESPMANEYVIYGHELNHILHTFGDDDVAICSPSHGSDGNCICIANDTVEVQIALAGDSYFNLKTLFSNDLPVSFTLDKRQCINAVELVRMVSNIVLADIYADGITIHGKDALGQMEMHIPTKVHGLGDRTSIKAAFNGMFLLEALGSIPAEILTVQCKSGIYPFYITDTDKQTATEIILPVHRNFS